MTNLCYVRSCDFTSILSSGKTMRPRSMSSAAVSDVSESCFALAAPFKQALSLGCRHQDQRTTRHCACQLSRSSV
jgi:hypothetical protein